MVKQITERKTAFKKTIRDGYINEYEALLGDLLVRAGQITKAQLDQALQYKKNIGGRLGSMLIRLGYIEDDTLANSLSRKLNFPILNISEHKVSDEVLKLVPYE